MGQGAEIFVNQWNQGLQGVLVARSPLRQEFANDLRRVFLHSVRHRARIGVTIASPPGQVNSLPILAQALETRRPLGESLFFGPFSSGIPQFQIEQQSRPTLQTAKERAET